MHVSAFDYSLCVCLHVPMCLFCCRKKICYHRGVSIYLSVVSLCNNTWSQITRRDDAGTNVDNAAYRVSKLQEHERMVLLITDEIYVSKRIEYADGDGCVDVNVFHDQDRGRSLTWIL